MKLKILIFVILLGLTLKFVWGYYSHTNRFKNKVYAGVYVDGKTFEGKTKEEVKKYFEKKSMELGGAALTIIYDKQPVATFSASDLKLKYDGETASIQAYAVGRSKHRFAAYYQTISSWLGTQKFQFDSIIEYDDTPIREFIEASEEKYNHPAENALFKFESGRVVNFKLEKLGLEIESKRFMTDFEASMVKLKKGEKKVSLQLYGKTISPEITLASSNSFGIEEEIATGRSDFSHSIPERVHNVILAASKFNGILIPKGQVFSFNSAIGDISSLTGYKPAYIIKEGKTVLGDGGGVCQVSTTLFRAALNAGLPIEERHAHAYRVSYYENDMKPGFDATVFSPTVDLKIKNDTPGYILIETEVDEANNLLYFRFYGKKDSRKVEVGESYVWDVTSPPPAKYQDDPTLKKGVTKQVDFPAWGSKASFTYKVTKDGKTVIDDKFYSVYKPWAAVYLVGTID